MNGMSKRSQLNGGQTNVKIMSKIHRHTTDDIHTHTHTHTHRLQTHTVTVFLVSIGRFSILCSENAPECHVFQKDSFYLCVCLSASQSLCERHSGWPTGMFNLTVITFSSFPSPIAQNKSFQTSCQPMEEQQPLISTKCIMWGILQHERVDALFVRICESIGDTAKIGINFHVCTGSTAGQSCRT